MRNGNSSADIQTHERSRQAARDHERRQWLRATLGTVARTAVGSTVASTAGLWLPGALRDATAAAGWPAKSIQLVVGYPPGGQTDFAARALTASMGADLHQSIVVDNRAGANGNIATDNVAKSAPDGYRLLCGNGGNMTLNSHTYQKSRVTDPRTLTPIGTMLTSALVLVVPASSPIRAVADFVEHAREKGRSSDGIDYGSSGPGSLVQGCMEIFRSLIGKPKMTHIAYKGSGPAMTDLIAGRFAGMFDGPSVVAPYVKSGQLRALMITGPRRLAVFPGVPSADESGYPECNVSSFIGLYGPAGLDKSIVERANRALKAALADASVRQIISERGDEPGDGSIENLARLTTENYTMWEKVARENDLRAE